MNPMRAPIRTPAMEAVLNQSKPRFRNTWPISDWHGMTQAPPDTRVKSAEVLLQGAGHFHLRTDIGRPNRAPDPLCLKSCQERAEEDTPVRDIAENGLIEG